MKCDQCVRLCVVCAHTPAEIFLNNLEDLLWQAPEDIVTITRSGNLYGKNVSIHIVKPSHIEGCWI